VTSPQKSVLPVLTIGVAAAVGFGMWSRLGGDEVSAEVELVSHELPGLEISVPDWEFESSGADPMYGALEVAQPGGNERFIKVQWARGPVPSAEEQVAQFAALFPTPPVHERPVTVAGSESVSLRFEMDGGKKAVVTPWRCPEEGMSGAVMTFLSLEWDELGALQDRILASARCLPIDHSAVPTRAYAALSPPEGWIGPEGPEVQVYEGAAGLIVSYPAMDAGLPKALATQPAMRAELIKTSLQLPDITMDPQGILLGGTRPAWHGQHEDPDGTVLHGTLTSFACAEANQGFALIYVSEEAGLAEGVETTLADAGCP